MKFRYFFGVIRQSVVSQSVCSFSLPLSYIFPFLYWRFLQSSYNMDVYIKAMACVTHTPLSSKVFHCNSRCLQSITLRLFIVISQARNILPYLIRLFIVISQAHNLSSYLIRLFIIIAHSYNIISSYLIRLFIVISQAHNILPYLIRLFIVISHAHNLSSYSYSHPIRLFVVIIYHPFWMNMSYLYINVFFLIFQSRSLCFPPVPQYWLFFCLAFLFTIRYYPLHVLYGNLSAA